jgi:hypothetical protein
MKTLIMLCLAMCGATMSLMAQELTGLPEAKVSLVGSLAHPLIVNNSARSIIGYTMHIWQGERQGYHEALNTRDLARKPLESAGILPGGSQEWAPSARPTGGPFTHLAIDAVIFSDGSFVGPDLGQAFDRFAERMAVTASYAQQAVNDSAHWARMESMVQSAWMNKGKRQPGDTRSDITKFAEESTADDLTLLRHRDGETLAYAAAVRYAAIPHLKKGK